MKKNVIETIIDSELSIYEKMIMLVINRNADSEGNFEVSHSDLSYMCGIGQTTLKKYLNKLYSDQLVHRQLRIDRKLGNIENVYKLMI